MSSTSSSRQGSFAKQVTLWSLGVLVVVGFGPLILMLLMAMFGDGSSKEAAAYGLVAAWIWASFIGGPLSIVVFISGAIWAVSALTSEPAPAANPASAPRADVIEVSGSAQDGGAPPSGVETATGAQGTPLAQEREHSDVRVEGRSFLGIVMALGIAAIVMPPVWSFFPTGLVYERLCQKHAGEHVYERVQASSYVLLGDGGDERALTTYHALEDVIMGRAEFIEVIRDSQNFRQRGPFRDLFGTANPPGTIFRVFLGEEGLPDCAKRLSPRYGTRLELEPGRCLRLMPVEEATSRYRVEAIENQKAAWYTPHIISYGARVIDAERNVTLGEYMRYSRTGWLAFFVIGGDKLSCPNPYHPFQPAQLHRKVLLGER